MENNWLDKDNWKEMCMDFASRFIQRTGHQKPTYKETLELDKDEFISWIMLKSSKENQEETLKEMIEHENETGSFMKTRKENDPPHIKMLYAVFDENKSGKIIDLLKNLDNLAKEYKIDNNDGDLVKQIISAKAYSDYFKLDQK